MSSPRDRLREILEDYVSAEPSVTKMDASTGRTSVISPLEMVEALISELVLETLPEKLDTYVDDAELATMRMGYNEYRREVLRIWRASNE